MAKMIAAASAGTHMGEFEKLIEAAKQGAVEDVGAIVHSHLEVINHRTKPGATALHYAAFGGHRLVAQLLIQHGSEINALDDQFGATPAGWAIEYLREMGGFLGIELSDLAHAIGRGDVEWTTRFLKRFPDLRRGSDTQGISF